jgi:hypothetical protein
VVTTEQKLLDKKHIERVVSRRGYRLGWNNEHKCYTVYFKDEYDSEWTWSWGGPNPVDPSLMREETVKRFHDIGLVLKKTTQVQEMWVLPEEKCILWVLPEEKCICGHGKDIHFRYGTLGACVYANCKSKCKEYNKRMD